MLKINLSRNVRKINFKASFKISFKINFKISFKINFKISRILILSWRISLKTRFSRIFYILN